MRAAPSRAPLFTALVGVIHGVSQIPSRASSRRCGCSAPSTSRTTPRRGSGTTRSSAGALPSRRHRVADRDRRDPELLAPRPVTTKPGSATRPMPEIVAEVVDEEGKTIEQGGGLLVLKPPWPSHGVGARRAPAGSKQPTSNNRRGFADQRSDGRSVGQRSSRQPDLEHLIPRASRAGRLQDESLPCRSCIPRTHGGPRLARSPSALADSSHEESRHEERGRAAALYRWVCSSERRTSTCRRQDLLGMGAAECSSASRCGHASIQSSSGSVPRTSLLDTRRSAHVLSRERRAEAAAALGCSKSGR